MTEPISATEALRALYRPKKVRVLFVGEAPPGSRTFFYAGNSQVYRYLKEALQSKLENPQDFLTAFAARGYFLDDLVLEPVDHLSKPQRRPIYQQAVPLLAQRMTIYGPEIIVTILKRISLYVENARSQAGINAPYHCVCFPGTGQQANFRREMADIIPLLP